jgi:hypothetical protein
MTLPLPWPLPSALKIQEMATYPRRTKADQAVHPKPHATVNVRCRQLPPTPADRQPHMPRRLDPLPRDPAPASPYRSPLVILAGGGGGVGRKRPPPRTAAARPPPCPPAAARIHARIRVILQRGIHAAPLYQSSRVKTPVRSPPTPSHATHCTNHQHERSPDPHKLPPPHHPTSSAGPPHRSTRQNCTPVQLDTHTPPHLTYP